VRSPSAKKNAWNVPTNTANTSATRVPAEASWTGELRKVGVFPAGSGRLTYAINGSDTEPDAILNGHVRAGKEGAAGRNCQREARSAMWRVWLLFKRLVKRRIARQLPSGDPRTATHWPSETQEAQTIFHSVV